MTCSHTHTPCHQGPLFDLCHGHLGSRLQLQLLTGGIQAPIRAVLPDPHLGADLGTAGRVRWTGPGQCTRHPPAAAIPGPAGWHERPQPPNSRIGSLETGATKSPNVSQAAQKGAQPSPVAPPCGATHSGFTLSRGPASPPSVGSASCSRCGTEDTRALGLTWLLTHSRTRTKGKLAAQPPHHPPAVPFVHRCPPPGSRAEQVPRHPILSKHRPLSHTMWSPPGTDHSLCHAAGTTKATAGFWTLWHGSTGDCAREVAPSPGH